MSLVNAPHNRNENLEDVMEIISTIGTGAINITGIFLGVVVCLVLLMVYFSLFSLLFQIFSDISDGTQSKASLFIAIPLLLMGLVITFYFMGL